MKEDTKETAVELLREWKNLFNRKQKNARYAKYNFVISTDSEKWTRERSRMEVISHRLDEMCEKAGISIQVGVEYTYGSFVYGHVFHGRAMDLEFSDPFKKYRPIPAREQQALQEWLLIKEGK